MYNPAKTLCPLCAKRFLMDKPQLTERDLDRIFNLRNGCLHVVHLLCYGVKLLNVRLKTRTKQLLGVHLSDIGLPVACIIKILRL